MLIIKNKTKVGLSEVTLSHQRVKQPQTTEGKVPFLNQVPSRWKRKCSPFLSFEPLNSQRPDLPLHSGSELVFKEIVGRSQCLLSWGPQSVSCFTCLYSSEPFSPSSLQCQPMDFVPRLLPSRAYRAGVLVFILALMISADLRASLSRPLHPCEAPGCQLVAPVTARRSCASTLYTPHLTAHFQTL